MEPQTDAKAMQALRDQASSENAHNERRIEALETQLGFKAANCADAQEMARELRETSKKLKGELKEATTKYENLQTSYDDLDAMHGAEERANEEKEEEINDLKTENARLEAELSDLNERCNELSAERTATDEAVAAKTGAANTVDKSQQTSEAIFQQQEDPNTTKADGSAPLRRIQSESPQDNEQQPANSVRSGQSPQRAPFKMNGSASNFVPSVRLSVSPFHSHYQAHLLSRQGSNSPDTASNSASPLSKFLVYTGHDHAEHTPVPKATGPDEVRNPHVRQLNADVHRTEWIRKSGKPDLVEDKDSIPGPDDVIGKNFSKS